MKAIFLILFSLSSVFADDNEQQVKLIILGIAQDAGYPQLNCYKPHCLPAYKDIRLKEKAVSIGIVDIKEKKKYMLEATPDIRQQMYNLHQFIDSTYKFAGVFLTHAHIGHYTGLMHMGREAAGTNKVNVYTMPKMKHFLENNGPWSQLVALKNIVLHRLQNQKAIILSDNLTLTPILVPHRDEFSETVGFYIKGPRKTALFIPDIDKWQKWSLDIVQVIKKVDYALLDATFYKNGEIPNRDMSEIPHPFVEESMHLFKDLSDTDKKKVYFIHFNHTNPLIQKGNEAQHEVKAKGFNSAYEGMTINL